MKKMLLLALVVISSSFSHPTAEALNAEERKFAVDYLNKTKARFLNDIKGLTKEQLNFKADSTRWSVAQCIEHIALAEDLFWNWSQAMMKEKANPARRSEIKFPTDKLIQLTLDRSNKFKAPEPLQPTGKFTGTDDAIKAFVGRRDSTILYIQTSQDDFKNHYMVHPAFGTLDVYQGLLLMTAHSERHTLQIEEVIANPNFPKK